ncbi:MAG: Kunitz/Bovine pancreatic trypsin inhibitor domain, partial [Pseudomonadota bacterium]
MRAAAAHDGRAVLKWCILALACGGETPTAEGRSSIDAGVSAPSECSLPAELSACSGGGSYFHDGAANRCRLSAEGQCSSNDGQFLSFEDCLRTCPEPVPEGCEGVLTPRLGRLWCAERGLNLTTSLACDQLVEHPRREITWHLLLEPSTDAALLEQRRDCVLR